MIEVKTAQMDLSDAEVAHWYRIEGVEGPQSECRRLLDLGFTPGEDVALVRMTPLGDPLVVLIRGTQLALRKREASWIKVSDRPRPQPE